MWIRVSRRVLAIEFLTALCVAAMAQGAPGAQMPNGDEAAEDVPAALFTDPTGDLHSLDVELDGAGVFTKFPEAFGGSYFDRDVSRLVVKYDATADPRQVAEFLAAVGSVGDAEQVKLSTEAASSSHLEVAGLAQTLAAEGAEWASVLGVEKIDGAYVDESEGAIVVFASGAVDVEDVTLEGVPVRIRGGGAQLVDQSRYDDAAPWSGGAVLRENTAIGPAWWNRRRSCPT